MYLPNRTAMEHATLPLQKMLLPVFVLETWGREKLGARKKRRKIFLLPLLIR